MPRPTSQAAAVAGVAPGVAATTGCPPHAILLPGGAWRLWRVACLRGAGFPARLALDLATPEAAAAADRSAAAAAEADARLSAVFRRLRAGPQTPEARRRIGETWRRLQRGADAAAPDDPDEAAWAAAARDAGRAATTLAHTFDAAEQSLLDRMRAIAEDPRFREAALWQSGDALAHAVSALGRANSQARKSAALIALLVQRYAVKNDTCGFFGPVGWATLADEPGFVRLTRSRDLMQRTSVYFEGWTIDALADRLDAAHDLRRWCMPRRKTGVWITDDEMRMPFAGRVDLSVREHRLLRACDGVSAAADLAARFAGGPNALFVSETDVFDSLRSLVDRGLIVWKLEVASQLHPEWDLARRIARIGDEATRDACATALVQLDEARHAVRCGQGNPDRLRDAMARLNATFTQLTGKASSRHHGQMYAGRSLVYMDGSRAGSVTIEQDLLERLGPPLSLMLDSLRWAAGEMAESFSAWLRAFHAQLRERLHTSAIDAEVFVSEAMAALWRDGAARPLIDHLQRRLRAAWRTVLVEPAASSPHRIAYDMDTVAPRARRAFPCDKPVWGFALQFSPDIMIRARGMEALERGEAACVLGEIHGGNTLHSSALAAQHPALDRLRAALARDTQGTAVVFRQLPKRSWLARSSPMLVLPAFCRYEIGDDLPSLPACRSLPASMLRAVDDGHAIVMEARDGSFTCAALELFCDRLSYELNGLANHAFADAGHTPRIDLGGLTVARERWTVTPADLPGGAPADRAARFATFRTWARAQGMPRWMFYKTPLEKKPCYLDLDSLVYVDLFAKFARQLTNPSSPIALVEMLPAFDETWLTDGLDHRYTCELRLVAQRARWEPAP